MLALKVKLFIFAQEYWRKCAYKMLVKLTLGCQWKNFSRGSSASENITIDGLPIRDGNMGKSSLSFLNTFTFFYNHLLTLVVNYEGSLRIPNNIS